MKFVCVFIIVFAVGCALATPVNKSDKDIEIVDFESDIGVDGNYRYSFENDDGSKAEQQGELRVIDPEHSAEVVRGSFSYTSADGSPISISYTADENGYQPVGDSLPVAPPIPPQILRALEYLATAPPPKEEK